VFAKACSTWVYPWNVARQLMSHLQDVLMNGPELLQAFNAVLPASACEWAVHLLTWPAVGIVVQCQKRERQPLTSPFDGSAQAHVKQSTPVKGSASSNG
jgi:hypothetical protein